MKKRVTQRYFFQPSSPVRKFVFIPTWHFFEL